MTLYLVTYSAIARNVATGDLAAALGAIPRDADTETLLGLVSLADVVTQAPPFVTRAMSYTSTVDPMIPNPELGAMLANFYTSTFSQALSTPVTSSPVSIVDVSLAPIVWARADVSPGPTVASWPDLSGDGNNLVQGAAPNQPARAFNPVIGQTVLHFAGTQVLDSAHPLAFDAFTYFVSFVSPGPAGLLFERGPNATTNSGEAVDTSAPGSLLVRRAGVTNTGNASAGWGIDNVWQLAEAFYTRVGAAGGVLSSDGTSIATVAALAAEAVSAVLHVGARTGPAVGFTGDMRELLVFPEGLSTADAAAVRAYMSAQIGL